MIHFKNHKGFSFIEMMAALAMMAIFGTSIMLVQTTLFQRLIKGHTKLLNMFVVDQYAVQFNEQAQQAFQEQKAIDTITFHHENKNPEYSINIKINQIPQNSALIKNFGKDIGITQITVIRDTDTDSWFNLIYTKAANKEKDSENKQIKSKEAAHEAQ